VSFTAYSVVGDCTNFQTSSADIQRIRVTTLRGASKCWLVFGRFTRCNFNNISNKLCNILIGYINFFKLFSYR